MNLKVLCITFFHGGNEQKDIFWDNEDRNCFICIMGEMSDKKQRKISIVALLYIKATKQSNVKARFDVVAISSAKDKPSIEIVKNAFELAYK